MDVISSSKAGASNHALPSCTGVLDDNGEIVDQLAGVQDFLLAKATYDAAVRRWPKARVRLGQEARIVEDSSDPH